MGSHHSSSPGRSQKGILGTLLMCAVLLIVLIVGIVAVDMAHVTAVASELQNATDAAALAGARDLDIDDGLAECDALAVAAQNQADGRPLANDSPYATVAVAVTPSNRERPGFVEVRAAVTTHHILAPVVGRFTDVITATSTAGPSGTVNQLGRDQAFPLAVSIDALPDGNGDGTTVLALNKHRMTDTITLYIDAQPVKNASFISFDNEPTDYGYLRDSLDHALGVETTNEASIPPLAIGDTVRLSDGIVPQHHLCGEKQYEALMAKPFVVMPVVNGYPQQQSEAKVIGFVGAKILDATIDWDRQVVKSLTIRLIKNIPRTKSGEIPPTGELANDVALNNISPGVLKLLPQAIAMAPADGIRNAASGLSVGLPMRQTVAVLRESNALTRGTSLGHPDQANGGPSSTPALIQRSSGVRWQQASAPTADRASIPPALRQKTGYEPEAAKRTGHGARPPLGLTVSAAPVGLTFAAPPPVKSHDSGPWTAATIWIQGTNTPSASHALSVLSRAIKRTDAGTWGATRALSITWEMVTLLWLAAGIGLALRHKRATACLRPGFATALARGIALQASLVMNHSSLIERLARIRISRESRPERDASTMSDILCKIRSAAHPWAPSRLGRIRAMRYWHFQIRRRSTRTRSPQSEPRLDIQRLRWMTVTLSADRFPATDALTRDERSGGTGDDTA